MTSTLRRIVLASACTLWVACSDAASPPSAKAPKRAAEPPAPAAPRAAIEAPEPPPSTALTSTSPTPPPSVATSATGSLKAADKDAATLADHPHDEPELTPVNYDRPLDPSEPKVTRFVLATGVSGREPVGERDTFSASTPKIFAFVQLANEAGAPYAFRVHWEKADAPPSPYGVKLTVPTAPRWRTWSWTAIRREPGAYRAVLRTLTGEEIARREFEIVAEDEADFAAPLLPEVDDH